jgi:hypothetical protein
MKNVERFTWKVCAAIILLTGWIDGAAAEEGRWGVGLRGGGAFLSQDLDLTQIFDGKTGPVVSGNLLYGLTDLFSVGLNVEWEKHKVEAGAADFGDAVTVSVIPFVEARGFETNGVSPYGSFGAGLNINSFDLRERDVILVDNLTPEQVAALDPSSVIGKVDRRPTVAVKLGAGADYFFTRHVALNAEIGWKLNLGKAELCTLSGACRTDRWNASVFTALLGFRYYF